MFINIVLNQVVIQTVSCMLLYGLFMCFRHLLSYLTVNCQDHAYFLANTLDGWFYDSN